MATSAECHALICSAARAMSSASAYACAHSFHASTACWWASLGLPGPWPGPGTHTGQPTVFAPPPHPGGVNPQKHAEPWPEPTVCNMPLTRRACLSCWGAPNPRGGGHPQVHACPPPTPTVCSTRLLELLAVPLPVVTGAVAPLLGEAHQAGGAQVQAHAQLAWGGQSRAREAMRGEMAHTLTADHGAPKHGP